MDINIVDTQEDALKEVGTSNIAQASKFCPLIKRQCGMDCASFVPGTFLEIGKPPHMFVGSDKNKGKFQWFPGRCDNMIITGSLQVDNCY